MSENALQSSSVTAKALRELREALAVARSVGVTESEVIELAGSVYKEDI